MSSSGVKSTFVQAYRTRSATATLTTVATRASGVLA